MDKLKQKNRQNLQCRRDIPIYLLFFIECFSIWQMGIVYFSGKSFSVFERTPLPLHVESTAIATVLGGIASIIFLSLFQKHTVRLLRVSAPAALICCIAMFFPLPELLLRAALYLQIFICLMQFGCVHALTILLFSEKSTIIQAVITSSFTAIFIAVMQNDLINIPFEIFNTISVISITLFFVTVIKLPVYIPVSFSGEEDKPYAPRLVLAGLIFLVFAATLTMEMAMSVADATLHGLSVIYLSSIAGALLFLFLWKKCSQSVTKLFTLFLSVCCIGFILAIVSVSFSALRLASCVVIGFGFIIFGLVSYFGQWAFRLYPSKWIAPAFPAMIISAIITHAAALDALRSNLNALYSIYGLTAAALLIVYLCMEPYLNYLRHKHLKRLQEKAPVVPSPFHDMNDNIDPLENLTNREREVAEHMLRGHTLKSMAKSLFISENTAATHKKEIYKKLGIHSKRELFEIMEKNASKAEATHELV